MNYDKKLTHNVKNALMCNHSGVKTSRKFVKTKQKRRENTKQCKQMENTTNIHTKTVIRHGVKWFVVFCGILYLPLYFRLQFQTQRRPRENKKKKRIHLRSAYYCTRYHWHWCKAIPKTSPTNENKTRYLCAQSAGISSINVN